MLKNKTFYLVFLLVAAIIVLLVVRILTPSRDSASVVKPPGLFIEKTSLSGERLSVSSEIDIYFSEPVNQKTLGFLVEPETEISFLLDNAQNKLIIAPSKIWGFDTIYTLTILRSTQSVNGNYLQKDYVYTFKTVPYSGI